MYIYLTLIKQSRGKWNMGGRGTGGNPRRRTRERDERNPLTQSARNRANPVEAAVARIRQYLQNLGR